MKRLLSILLLLLLSILAQSTFAESNSLSQMNEMSLFELYKKSIADKFIEIKTIDKRLITQIQSTMQRSYHVESCRKINSNSSCINAVIALEEAQFMTMEENGSTNIYEELRSRSLSKPQKSLLKKLLNISFAILNARDENPSREVECEMKFDYKKATEEVIRNQLYVENIACNEEYASLPQDLAILNIIHIENRALSLIKTLQGEITIAEKLEKALTKVVIE